MVMREEVDSNWVFAIFTSICRRLHSSTTSIYIAANNPGCGNLPQRWHTFPMIINMNTVTIYTTPTCPYCVAAKALLRKKGVHVNEIGIEGDRAAAFSLVRRTGRATVPQIFIGAKHIGGFDDLYALEQAGHLDRFLDPTNLKL
jgi:glutaredoxin 3